MDFAFDAAKSAKNTRERGLPIDRVVELDWGRAVAFADDRFADGEDRILQSQPDRGLP
jgi:uncharacterized DUF497 family protein